MSGLILEYYADVCIDTLSGKVVKKAVFLRSGARNIYIGPETCRQIIQKFRDNGVNIDDR